MRSALLPPLIFPAIVLGIAFVEVFVHFGQSLWKSNLNRPCLGGCLCALRSTLCAARRASNPSGTGRGGRYSRCEPGPDIRQNYRSADGTCTGVLLAFRFPNRRPRGLYDPHAGRGRTRKWLRSVSSTCGTMGKSASLRPLGWRLDGYRHRVQPNFLLRRSALSAAGRLTNAMGT